MSITDLIGLNALAERIHKRNVEKGFYDDDNKPEGKYLLSHQLLEIMKEVAEASEADKTGKLAQSNDVVWCLSSNDRAHITQEEFPAKIKDTFQDEIADVFIRLLDLVGHCKIDIEAHIALKLEYNATRKRLHGKSY